jgi:hypothetical protein
MGNLVSLGFLDLSAFAGNEVIGHARWLCRESWGTRGACVAGYLATGDRDVKRPQDVESPELHLRVGDDRVRFYDLGDSIVVLAVKHRREAYRNLLNTNRTSAWRILALRAAWNPFIRQGCCWHWMASTRELARPFGGTAPTMSIAKSASVYELWSLHLHTIDQVHPQPSMSFV